MAIYYVNDHAQKNGDHEVHHADCSWLELAKSKTYLGEFPTCHSAVKAAKIRYPKSNGCAYCSADCHTR